MSRPRFHRLKVADVRRETPDAVSIGFAIPPALASAYRFRPGQYLTLRTMVDGEDCRRSYSICTAPEDRDLRVAIKLQPGGRFSAWANRSLRAGDELAVMTPDGRFGIDIRPGEAGTYVALAAGSGITPILSILRAVLLRQPESQFLLFYGNRTTADVMFRAVIDDLKDRYLARLSVHHVLSREQQELPALNGRLDPPRVERLLSQLAPVQTIDHLFLCGPPAMTESLEPALRGFGLPPERLSIERFTTDAAVIQPRAATTVSPASEPAAVARAVVTFDGAQHELALEPGETIIDAAVRSGVDLPFSCRGGMCCTCRARLLEGRVEMAVNYSLEPWETAAGYVLTCQSHPRTPLVVLDYDHV